MELGGGKVAGLGAAPHILAAATKAPPAAPPPPRASIPAREGGRRPALAAGTGLPGMEAPLRALPDEPLQLKPLREVACGQDNGAAGEEAFLQAQIMGGSGATLPTHLVPQVAEGPSAHEPPLAR